MSELQFDVKQKPGVINVNFETLSRQLSEKMKEYKNAVFTEESKSIAKAEVASLRKLKKAIDDRRKEVKKQCMLPYESFEVQVKRLLVLVDEPIEVISEQLENFEKKRIKEKQAAVKITYEGVVPFELKDYLRYEEIYDPKWENATTSLKAVKEQMQTLVKKVEDDILALKNIGSDATEKALEMYKANHNLPAAIQYINTYEHQKAEIITREEQRVAAEKERALELERERIRKEERKRIAEEEQIRKNAEIATIEKIKEVNEEEAKPLTSKGSVKAIYTVVATPQELVEIEMALTSLGVHFERKDV